MTYKILRQPTTDPVFQSLCAGTTAHAVFAHIRAASGATAITHYNNHPFAFGRLAFMHNGSVAHFDEIKRALALELERRALERGEVLGRVGWRAWRRGAAEVQRGSVDILRVVVRVVVVVAN